MYFLQAFRPIGFDLLATIFFVALFWLSGDILLATAAGVAAGLARFAYIKYRRQPVGPLQYVSLILVVVAGITTLITKDPHFVMIKSSVISLAVAAVMLRTNWMEPYLPPIVRNNLNQNVIVWASRGWGYLLITLAITNAVVALTFSTNIWAWYASLVPISAQLLAFLVQYLIFRNLIGRAIRARMASEALQ